MIGLVHISEMSEKFVKDPKDIVKVGDIVKVKVTQITDKGVNVSRKALLPKPVIKKEEDKGE